MMNRIQASKKSILGFTIIEMLIANLIGIVLVGGVLGVFQTNLMVNNVQYSLSRMQENSRAAMNLFNMEIRAIGYTGCFGNLAAGAENTLNSPTAFAWDVSNSLSAMDNVSAGLTLGGATGGQLNQFIAGTDILIIRSTTHPAPVSTATTGTSIQTTQANNFVAGDIMVISNCDQASIFQAANINTSGSTTTISSGSGSVSPGNNTASLTNLFDESAQIGRLATTVFYIANGNNGRPAFFQSRLQVTTGTNSLISAGEELLSNVENMQLQFAEDTDGDGDIDLFSDASTVANWTTVLGVRVALLLSSSSDSISSDKNSYSFDNTSFAFVEDVTPSPTADRRLRKTVSFYSAIRNRIL